jgi:hypothetical protein
MIGSNVVPFVPPGGPMMPPQAPPMMLNPAFAQWMQLKQAWDAETQRRQQEFEDACALIREDVATSYKIDIEADSTVAADEQAEQAAITEFMRAILPLSEVLIPQMSQSGPIADFAGELLKFGFRAFPASRQIEEALEQFVDGMKKGPPQPPPQQGKGNTKSPQEIQAETAVEGAKLQAQQQQTAAKAQTDQQANATKLISAQIEAQADRERAAAENQLRITELALRGREMVGKEALDQARLARIEARNTQGLV